MMDLKDTNPKDACGIRKAPLSCVPLPVLLELGCAMLEGQLKYARHNYRAIGVRASVYFDAAIRHLFAWWEGEDLDPDSEMSHLVKAMACLAVLRDAQLQGKCTDDRPPPTPDGWVAVLNERAGELLDRYPNPPAPYTRDWDRYRPLFSDEDAKAFEELESRMRERSVAQMANEIRLACPITDEDQLLMREPA